ncbi:MAG: phospholipase D-like domain-containing protein [Caldilinea sp.]|nr:phospholipase D-like domain-containing protein [Caldilinea sp.]
MRPYATHLNHSTLLLFVICGCILGITHSAGAQTPPPDPPPASLLYLPAIQSPPPARILIAAAHIDSAISYEPDEAILLWNAGMQPQSLAGWALKAGTRTARFPVTATVSLAPGERLWCTGQADIFQRSFGERPGCTWDDEAEDAIHLDNRLSLVNTGGGITVMDADGATVDVLVYGTTAQSFAGWSGEPAKAYTRGLVSAQGQIWQRKRDPTSNEPIDSDTAADWAGDLSDLRWGRRVSMPGWAGWDAGDGWLPASTGELATTTVAVGPEGLYAPMATFIAQTTHTLDLSLYTLEHAALAAEIAAAAGRGVRVRMLLEGSPPGGISDMQKWCVTQIAQAGGDIRYLAVADDAPAGYKRRYRFLHAKYGIADGSATFVGTENLTLDAMPMPDTGINGGRRGFYLFSDASGLSKALSALFQHDWQPDVFADLRPYEASHAKYGAPPVDFVMPEAPTYPVAEAPFAQAVAIYAQTQYTIVSVPENGMRPDAGILKLIERAGTGDSVEVMQLYENAFWGESSSNAIADPNPRLEAMIDAARRGARVRLLLDSLFDDAESLRNNQVTVDYVRAVAGSEGLDLDARLGNPTGGGIHAKLVLASIGGERWSAVGSLNGSESSHKINREVVLLVDRPEIYARLADVFEHDWALGQ